jgi:hypothetical protein
LCWPLPKIRHRNVRTASCSQTSSQCLHSLQNKRVSFFGSCAMLANGFNQHCHLCCPCGGWFFFV